MKIISDWPGSISELQMQAYLSDKEAAELAGVSRRTWKKYRDTDKAPKAVFELLKARSGSIWPGWTYRDERLISPDGQDFGPYDYMAFYYLRAAVESEKVALHPQIIPQMRKKLFK